MGSLINNALTGLSGVAAQVTPVVSAYQDVRGTYQDLTGRSAQAQAEAQRAYEAERARLAFEEAQAQERRVLGNRQQFEETAGAARHSQAASELAQTSAAAEQERRGALRKAISSQRSLLGASGVSAVDGSGQAVLRGLKKESETEARRSNDAARLRRAALDRELDESRHRNLLEAYELAERQRVERIARGYA